MRRLGILLAIVVAGCLFGYLLGIYLVWALAPMQRAFELHG